MMIRVALLNNYSTRRARRAYGSGAYPGQHLWGLVPPSTHLRWTISYGIYDLPLPKFAWSRSLRSAVSRAIGDPIQQIRVLLAGVDVIFAADQWSASLIGLLRRIRILRIPYVVIVHHKPSSRWNSFCLRGADAVCVLSPSIGQEVRASLHLESTTLLPWGPDLDWPVYATSGSPEFDFVAAGKTNRDYLTLRASIREGGLSGLIFDGKARTQYVNGRQVSYEERPASYPEIIGAMVRAKTVAVPLRDPDVMAGLTEMADALALGVPIVMTKSPRIPYDIEGTASGRLVAPGSVGELSRAIEEIAESHSSRTPSLITRDFNMWRYQDALYRLFEGLMRRG